MNQVLAILETPTIIVVYLTLSACLIGFNKYLMHEDRFPHAAALTSLHMFSGSILSITVYSLKPDLFPSMGKAKDNLTTVLKFMMPLALLFALGLWTSNQAYFYCSVAFLQFCKQSNVAWMFVISCICGLQSFSWLKTALLLVIIFGCSLCVHGEMKYSLYGLQLQAVSQACEITKLLLSEAVMGGTGLKLDALTFVLFQTVLSFVPLACATFVLWTPDIVHAVFSMWPILLLNCSCAFALNVTLALVLKRLSAVALVISGLCKDMVIIASSYVIFGDPISSMQYIGAAITLVGMGAWSSLKLQEEARKEKAPLLEQTEKLEKP